MRLGLLVSVARKFMRSRSLVLSTVVTSAGAAVLVAMFIAMKAFTLSGEQIVDRDLGRFAAQLDLSNVSSLKPGDARLAEEVVASARRAGGREAVASLTSFDIRPDVLSPPLVLYVETDWSRNPFPDRYSLTEGRWPARPGEVVLTRPLRAAIGPGDTLPVLSGNERFRIVGTANDRFESLARILAANGTWRGFGEGTRRNFSTVLATPALHFDGDAERVLAEVRNTLERDDLTDVPRKDLAAQLGAGLRTRGEELVRQRRSWIERIPLAYQIPSLALPLLSVVTIFGLNSRRFRRSSRVLRSIGMDRSVAAGSIVLATSAWVMISAVLGAIAGIGLGLAARPVCDYFLAGPVSPVPSVVPPISRVLWVTALSCLLVGLAFGTERQKPRIRVPVLVERRAQIGRVVTPARRLGGVVAGLAALAQISVLDSVPEAMVMAGTLGLTVLLFTPEIVGFAIGLVPGDGPRTRLGRRQLTQDRDRTIAGVAVLAAALGAPLAMLTMLATLISTAEEDRAPEVAPRQVVLSSPAGSFHPPSPEVVRVAASRMTSDNPMVHTGYLWTDQVIVTVQNAGMGTVLVVESADAAGRLNNAALSAQQAETLRDGGILVWAGETRRGRALLLNDAKTDRVISATEPLPASRIDFQTPWDQPTGGLILADTARRLGLQVEKAAVVFTNVPDEQAAAVKQAVIDAGLDPLQVGIHQPPRPVRVPPVFYTAAVGLALIVLVTTIAVARTQVLTLRGYAGRLISVGLSRRWVRQVLFLQSGVVVAVSTVLALLIAVPPVVVMVLRLSDFTLSIPWQWLGTVVVAFFVATALATLISTRRLRAVDRFSV